MQARLANRVMSIKDIANLATIEAPKKRGSNKKKENTHLSKQYGFRR
jgi:hypothetical protein